MKRREFIGIGIAATAVALPAWAQGKAKADAKAKPLTDKEILKEGQPATIANYCENPTKQPNKVCPSWKEGNCGTCMFYNKDNSKTTFKGKEYARCQLLADPKKPQFVLKEAWCATYVKQA